MSFLAISEIRKLVLINVGGRKQEVRGSEERSDA